MAFFTLSGNIGRAHTAKRIMEERQSREEKGNGVIFIVSQEWTHFPMMEC